MFLVLGHQHRGAAIPKDEFNLLPRTGRIKAEADCADALHGEVSQQPVRQWIPDDGDTVFDDLVLGEVRSPNRSMDDLVIARADGTPLYNLAVAVDDALQGATDIIRGQDLFWSTGIHRLLQTLLGLPEPTYHHHKLILDETGQKLAKSTNATGLRELRAAGIKPFDIRRMVGLGR